MDRFLVKRSSPNSANALPGKKVKTDTHNHRVTGTDCDSKNMEAGASGTDKLSSKNEEKKQGFQFQKVKGDLFKCPSHHCLAHCISQDIRMGKGIATLFKSKFGGVQDLIDQGVKTGGVAVLKRQSRFIYYLITKDKYWQKPTYDSLQSTLMAMANHCREHKVTHVSMPLIGCGLDGLKWPRVENIIKDIFKDDDIIVTVYTL